MATSSHTKNWIKEHSRDPYVKKAKQENLRARSVYKLIEINNKYGIIKKGMTVIDLGSAPGSWSEYVMKIVKNNQGVLVKDGVVIAVDKLNMQPINGVLFINGDFTEGRTIAKIINLMGVDGKADVVISDLAPNTSGIRHVDQCRSMELVCCAHDFAIKVLKFGGSFLCKVFQNDELNKFLAETKTRFREVKIIKPLASKSKSKEIFLLYINYIKR